MSLPGLLFFLDCIFLQDLGLIVMLGCLAHEHNVSADLYVLSFDIKNTQLIMPCFLHEFVVQTLVFTDWAIFLATVLCKLVIPNFLML